MKIIERKEEYKGLDFKKKVKPILEKWVIDNYDEIFSSEDPHDNIDYSDDNNSVTTETTTTLGIFTLDFFYLPVDAYVEAESLIEEDRRAEIEYFIKEYPEIAEKLGKDNISYNSLSDAGYDDEADFLDDGMLESEYTLTLALEVIFNNVKKKNTDSITVIAYAYFEGDKKNNYSVYEEEFDISSIKDLEESLKDAYIGAKKIWKQHLS